MKKAFKFVSVLLAVLLLISSCGDGSGFSERGGVDIGDDNYLEQLCSECSEPVYESGEFCEEHTCPTCNDYKDDSYYYCDAHRCEECGELKNDYDDNKL